MGLALVAVSIWGVFYFETTWARIASAIPSGILIILSIYDIVTGDHPLKAGLGLFLIGSDHRRST
jgi:hypothetical protein